MSLIKQKLTLEQENKSKEDLRIINLLTKIGRDDGLRIVISGGYAVDGFLGEITRFHNDIDIQIYGTEQNAKKEIDELLSKIGDANEYTIEDKGRKEYYYYLVYKFKGLTLDFYYLQTKTSPLGKEKFIIKADGNIDEQEFGESVYGRINDTSFEIQDPLVEMKDKIYKREERGDPKRPEHDQDISNLKLILGQ